MIRIVVMPGDGIGKEVTIEAMRVLMVCKEKFNIDLKTEEFDINGEKYLRTGKTITYADLDNFRTNFDAILLGAFGDPRVDEMGYLRDLLLTLRFGLDLYINFRPFKLYDAKFCPLKGVKDGEIDFVIFRENTEGMYVGSGGFFKKGSEDEIAINESINTRKGVERIIKASFDYAVKNNKTRVLLVDKCNVLIFAHNLWHRVFYEIGERYPQIEKEHLLIDVCAMEMVRKPQRFEVIVTENMFGDILSDLAAQVVGGLGLAPSGNINPEKISLFEPVHGSAPDIAGKNKANPVASILSAGLLLEYLGEKNASKAIEDAVKYSLNEGVITPDLGGKNTTTEVGKFIADYIEKR